MLSDLVDLAREPSSDKRRELLGRISDLFLAEAAKYDDQEVVLFNDVLMRLLDHVDVDVRAEFSQSVVHTENAGHALHEKLARDEYPVAEPILVGSDKLGDGVLIEIAQEKGQEHLRAISQRERLSPAVTDVLVTRGENDVLRIVTCNPGAEFSEVSLGTLAEKAVRETELAEALCLRGDLPPEIAERVMVTLPRHAKQQLGLLMKSDSDATVALLERVPCLIRDERIERRVRRLAIRGKIAKVKDGEEIIDPLVVDLANRDDIIDVCFVIAEMTSLEENVAQSCLFKIESEPIAVLLNAMDVTALAVDAVAKLRCRRLNLPNSMRRRLIDIWRNLDHQTCERVMRFIRIRANA